MVGLLDPQHDDMVSAAAAAMWFVDTITVAACQY